MTANSIVNLGELSKPATVLIEKIGEAVGGLCKPWQIKRVAKAEAEADRIQAESQIEITDLRRRALCRFIGEEEKKQQNMEEIIQKAIPQIKEDAKPENVDNDWIANFFDKCRLISNSEMQTLWSRVLAGESNTPGSFSKRTVTFLSTLDKQDADLFTSLCRFQWLINGEPVPIIPYEHVEVCDKLGLPFDVLRHLNAIGLITFDGLNTFSLCDAPPTMEVFYYGQGTLLDIAPRHDNKLQIGRVLLTQVGKELAPICGSAPDEGVRHFILGFWRDQGHLKKDGLPPQTPPDESSCPPNSPQVQ